MVVFFLKSHTVKLKGSDFWLIDWLLSTCRVWRISIHSSQGLTLFFRYYDPVRRYRLPWNRLPFFSANEKMRGIRHDQSARLFLLYQSSLDSANDAEFQVGNVEIDWIGFVFSSQGSWSIRDTTSSPTRLRQVRRNAPDWFYSSLLCFFGQRNLFLQRNWSRPAIRRRDSHPGRRCWSSTTSKPTTWTSWWLRTSPRVDWARSTWTCLTETWLSFRRLWAHRKNSSFPWARSRSFSSSYCIIPLCWVTLAPPP